jgi:hypothetical protein
MAMNNQVESKARAVIKKLTEGGLYAPYGGPNPDPDLDPAKEGEKAAKKDNVQIITTFGQLITALHDTLHCEVSEVEAEALFDTLTDRNDDARLYSPQHFRNKEAKFQRRGENPKQSTHGYPNLTGRTQHWGHSKENPEGR